MSKIINLGDLHISGNNPKCRLDNLVEVQFQKLEEVIKFANKYKMDIYQNGDFFDSPNISYAIYTRVHNLLRRLETSFFFVYGNHDYFFDNPKTKTSTPLFSLQSTSPNVHHVYNSDLYISYQNWKEDIIDMKEEIFISHRAVVSNNYFKNMKEKWLVNTDVTCNSLTPELEKYRIIFCGHWHKRYIESKRHSTLGTQIIINPGALTRREANQDSLDTFPSFVVFDIKTEDIELVPLKCAKKAEEVISEKHLELTRAKRSMTKSIEDFMDNLKKKGKVNKRAFLFNLQNAIIKGCSEDEIEYFQEILNSCIGDKDAE
jgi:DNA repair exonuclease SbcCD nuclease subunit